MSILDRFLSKRGSSKNPQAEMGFVDHLEELRWHILRSLIALLVGAVIAFININYIFDSIILAPAKSDFISNKYLCKLGDLLNIEMLCSEGAQLKFQNTQLTGQFMMSFSVAAMVGFIIASPYIFWEFWRFLKPAFKNKERQHAKGFVFWVSLLFLLGVSFAYFVVIPFTISFFAQYILSPSFENIITVTSYYQTMSDLVIGIGLIFELPVLVYFLSKLGIITPQFLREKRRYAIVVILFLSAIITPPDWFTIFLVSLPLYGLFEISILVSARIQGKENDKKALQDLDW